MMSPTTVTPADAFEDQPTIGLIGMGAMGEMYAKYLSQGGWKKINVCDLPSKYESLREKYANTPGITVLQDGHAVARVSEFIMFSVEAEHIDKVVAQYGPSCKVGAIVAGQTSVKAPEKDAFEKYLPLDTHIVSLHSLHGPTVSPVGQPLVIIKHRAPDWAVSLVENILKCFRSRFVYLTYEDHDLVTANVQAVTHAAFLTMGTAWAAMRDYPWQHGQYVGGIETVKVNIMHRIYANKWHVYAGLAILNPSAKVQIDQYASSATELFKLMLAGDEPGLRARVFEARERVFGQAYKEGRVPIFLTEDVLDQFTIGGKPSKKAVANGDAANDTSAGNRNASPNSVGSNSHLSLLAMVDCWAKLGIHPFVHLDLAATPIFRMWIGVAEYLFRSEARLDAAVRAALYDTSHRSDDLEFVVGARGWSQCVSFGNFELYRRRFAETAAFFEPQFDEANTIGGAMIKAISESSKS
ncbi:prephenate dehydrogenase [Coniophora puteana RWD-64-598 SS2]|uniref:Prephenate dehydrogenase [NADP(+)] n=1 Tax=Coniophora puteana (strain RWD-64-598) TaxID=741705 RepID=A0A5M3MIF9_CONPW|nr:prephenate dehydrogenase [Coniophora puteana RWD-64-598 SS2]EIW78883.1 prephenate dehydrogenase [Coniophora puteana RWD-64-598 SS2]